MLKYVMAMKRINKNFFIKKLVDIFVTNDSLILVNFKFINAIEFLTLRNYLKTTGEKRGILVIKNTLALLALRKASKFSCLLDKFFGPVAIIYSNDIVDTTKLLFNFIKNNAKKISIICAAHLNRLYTVEDLNQIAKLPSLNELRIRVILLLSYNIPVRITLPVNLLSIKLIKILGFFSSKINLLSSR